MPRCFRESQSYHCRDVRQWLILGATKVAPRGAYPKAVAAVALAVGVAAFIVNEQR